MDAAIVTSALTKRFGQIVAVDDLFLHVERGEIYGFLGLNGAGKTTTIRMLLGMIRPDTGSVSIFGHDVRPGGKGPWSSVGYMVEIPHSYPELTVRENLRVAHRLRLMREPAAVDTVIRQLGLAAYANRKAGTLSLGNKQRLGLAKALLGNPELLILDEPANGLDPAGIVEIRELLRGLAHQHGVTVLMSSHILSEVARLASRIGVIHQGRLVEEMRSEEVDRRRRRKLLVDVRDRNGAHELLRQSGHLPELEEDGVLRLTDESALERPEDVARLLVEGGHPPMLVRVDEEDLESYFLRLVGSQHRGPA